MLHFLKDIFSNEKGKIAFSQSYLLSQPARDLMRLVDSSSPAGGINLLGLNPGHELSGDGDRKFPSDPAINDLRHHGVSLLTHLSRPFLIRFKGEPKDKFILRAFLTSILLGLLFDRDIEVLIVRRIELE